MPQAEVAFNNLYSIQVGNRSMTIDYMVWMILSDASSPAVVRGIVFGWQNAGERVNYCKNIQR